MNPFTEHQFRAALDSRDIIGQAKGMMKIIYGVSDDQAFEVLKSLSQAENVKLRDVAERLCVQLPMLARGRTGKLRAACDIVLSVRPRTSGI